MCDPVVASFGSSAVSAIGGAMQTSASNKAKKKDYEYKLKVRENRWMRERSGYQTKIVQYKTNLSEANIAAQRAYSKSQISLNNIRSKAMLDHQEDFKSMLKTEGAIEASAAERGIRGATVRRQISANLAALGNANAQRSRALTLSKYAYFDHNAGIARKVRSKQNSLFGKVAISPTPDLAPPPPVMQNVGAQLFLGLAGAGFDAAGAHFANKSTDG
nr:uncharacterized protein [uncultured Mediterranean phage uvMED]BAR27110.1 uncharacterized protein [uncultured Mediterranean phage uvMED]